MVLRIASLLLALAATPAMLAQAGDATCKYSDSETCPVEDFTPDVDDGSVLVYPGGNTRCAFDDYTDSKTTFSTNATYFFQVFPNESLDKSKVLLYFQGGGACIDKYTCNFGVQCALGASPLFTSVATASSAGVLNRSVSDNMFNDWNIVHIPYCTGDLHVGDKTTASYTTGYEVALGNSQCLGQNKSMHMNGYNNAQSALQWALANYPEPEHLVLAGYSAGSLSAQLYSSYVANLWDVDAKSIKYQVLADSYVGVFPEDETPASVLLDYFGACDVDLDLAENVSAACKAETLKTVELVSSLVEQVPSSDWLFIDSKGDKTQRKFYELVKDGISGYPFTNLISEADFFSNMTVILDAYEAISSKITTFNVESTLHVYLRENNFMDYVSDAGLLLGDVINTWLAQE